MKIYNTLSNKLGEFKPINDKKVNFFVCGPTVYDYAHIGNAKTYTQFDFIVKYLRYRGYDVFYLQNITDIDDKIIQKAQEKQVTHKDISEQYAKIYLEDMKSLGNTAVSQYAKATDYINQIVNQVERLKEKGFAYTTSDGIYYEIQKFKNYGKLSGRTELKKTDGVSRIDSSTEKRGWNDFCLWKFSKPGEPFWETELGKGRPGWHIEDTAITESFFGPQYDIHGGAVDLIFPHHEAEIAQMEALSNKSPLVKCWMHVGFLKMSNAKMSKSLGNFLTIRGVLKNYNFRVLRLLYLSGHYRSSIEFSEEILEQTKNSLERIDEFVFNIKPDLQLTEEKRAVDKLKKDLINSLDNDFETPRAISLIFNFIKERNTKEMSGMYTLNFLKEINQFLGFFEFNNDSDEEINELVNQRNQYRKTKKYQEADEIKQKLLAKGIKLYDSEVETKWRKINI
jgi:cysteinyl-tRNA synthetase